MLCFLFQRHSPYLMLCFLFQRRQLDHHLRCILNQDVLRSGLPMFVEYNHNSKRLVHGNHGDFLFFISCAIGFSGSFVAISILAFVILGISTTILYVPSSEDRGISCHGDIALPSSPLNFTRKSTVAASPTSSVVQENKAAAAA